MAQTASQHSTYETPPPIQKPVFPPLPPAQLAPAGGNRRAKFVEQRPGTGLKPIPLIIFAGLSICMLLVLIGGGYLLLQNLAQPAGQNGQTTKIYPTAVPTLPPLTSTDPHELYQQAMKRKTLLDDPLKTQSPYDWEATNTDGSCMFENQQLHLSSIQGGKAILCLEQALTFDNFAFQARMTLHQGDTGGLLMRANTAGNKLYMFGLSTSGRYLLASVQPQTGSQPQIITGGLSSAIKQGTNQLTIIAHQHTFYLYINGRYQTKINDSTINVGKIGLFAGDSQQNTPDATFSNAKVWGV
ncbi:hypothetical protein [Dictyobacter vulcani]|uniref:hypothetical protein n=1 Tax=Dictyobacter vulcani TaxID=2607529 RepID=UPI001386B201|nr:hypothetical protein [Dictyobacter vulcani]